MLRLPPKGKGEAPVLTRGRHVRQNNIRLKDVDLASMVPKAAAPGPSSGGGVFDKYSAPQDYTFDLDEGGFPEPSPPGRQTHTHTHTTSGGYDDDDIDIALLVQAAEAAEQQVRSRRSTFRVQMRWSSTGQWESEAPTRSLSFL